MAFNSFFPPISTIKSQNCFEDFTEDLDLGVIYLDVLKYYLSDSNALSLSTIINNIESFLFTNTDYDIMSNKPATFESTFDLMG